VVSSPETAAAAADDDDESPSYLLSTVDKGTISGTDCFVSLPSSAAFMSTSPSPSADIFDILLFHSAEKKTQLNKQSACTCGWVRRVGG